MKTVKFFAKALLLLTSLSLTGCERSFSRANPSNGSQSWLVGEGEPSSSSSYKEGDCYFDTKNGSIYKYEGAGWVLVYHLDSNSSSFHVTFDLNGGVYDGKTIFEVPYGGFVEKIPEPYLFGKEFVGFYTGDGKNDLKFTNYTPVYRDMTLIARYESPFLKEEISQRKYQLYHELQNTVYDYSSISEKNKEIFKNYIERLENAKTEDEIKEIYNECSSWIKNSLTDLKTRLKGQLQKIIDGYENQYKDRILSPYLNRILNSIDSYEEEYQFLRYYTQIAEIIPSLADVGSLDVSGCFEREFESIRQYIKDILYILDDQYHMDVHPNDTWNIKLAYFTSDYDENSSIKDFLENVVYVLEYIPNNLIERELTEAEKLKIKLAQKLNETSSDYEPILGSLLSNFIKKDDEIDELNQIEKIFDFVLNLKTLPDKDVTQEIKNHCLDWIDFYAIHIRFDSDTLNQTNIITEAYNNYEYINATLKFVIYLKDTWQKDKTYDSSIDLYHAFDANPFSNEQFSILNSALDSYLNRYYNRFNIKISTEELRLLSKINVTDYYSSITENRFAQCKQLADNYKSTLESDGYRLSEEDKTQYDQYYNKISSFDTDKSLASYLEDFDTAMEYLFDACTL